MTTKALYMPVYYDFNKLTFDECNAIEDICEDIYYQLVESIKNMGLDIILPNFIVTKFTSEEKKKMEEDYKKYVKGKN